MNLKMESPFWIRKLDLPTHSFQSQARRAPCQVKMPELMKPPPFVTGGFVGSKSIEHHVATFEFSILEALLRSARSTDLVIISRNNCWTERRKTAPHTLQEPKSYAEAVRVSAPSLCTETSQSVSHQEEKQVESMPSVTEQRPLAGTRDSGELSRTVSECSDQSWVTVDREDSIKNSKVSNPWLRTIMGDDLDDSDDSDEDYVCSDTEEDEDTEDDGELSDDFRSENGEVVDTSKWVGEVLSPIASPVGSPVDHGWEDDFSDDYDSDDSEGFIVQCGPIEDDDEALEAEKKSAEDRIRDANARWLQSLEEHTDETDCKPKKKQVRFASEDQLTRVQPMIAWSHAYRAARKGDWEVLARDSERFRARIASTARVLDPILSQSHRAKMWSLLHEPDVQQTSDHSL